MTKPCGVLICGWRGVGPWVVLGSTNQSSLQAREIGSPAWPARACQEGRSGSEGLVMASTWAFKECLRPLLRDRCIGIQVLCTCCRQGIYNYREFASDLRKACPVCGKSSYALCIPKGSKYHYSRHIDPKLRI